MKSPRPFPHVLVMAMAGASLLSFPPPLPADVRITEVMSDNVATVQDRFGSASDWIELHNDGDTAVDLAGWFLTDSPGDLEEWEFPSVTLDPGGYLLVFASGRDLAVPGEELHTNFLLKNGGEFLALVMPDGTSLGDAYEPEIPQLDEDQSFGVQRVSDNWVLHYFDTPTPGAENEGGSIAELVDFSITGRTFNGALELRLSSRSGSAIRYSTDGNRPNLFNGTPYVGPIAIDSTTIITASITGGPLRQEVFFEIDENLQSFSSNLPVVIMQSEETITTTREEMLIALLEPEEDSGRTAMDGPFQMSARGEARVRGSSTASFPKQSFRIEFQDADGEDRVLKPFGMPAESDWILSGRYEEDRSLVRNEFIYALSRQIGRYAARTRFCEVYVHRGDGPVTAADYRGAYSFMENMKRDGDRIDIDNLLPEHDQEPEITGGYIFKRDRSGPTETVITGGGETVNIADPDSAALTVAQRDYLRNYLNNMQASFGSSDLQTGYPAFIDVGSWIDHHLLNTLMLNVDSLRLSTYFYKERNGKVFAGPIWDFNISSGSRDRFGSPPRASRPDVWRGISGDRGTTFFTNGTQRWWGDLFALRDFQQAYCDRWHELRKGAFRIENIHALIDSLADELREAQPRNQERWPQVPPEYGGWQGEINHLKDWLADRVTFMDAELVAPPTFTPAGGAISTGTAVKLKGRRGTLFSPTTLYYTTDGSDPRLPGGEISETAIAYDNSGITLTESTTIVAREHIPGYTPEPDGPDQEWSAPGRFQFVIGTPAGSENLVISEVMYHPSNPSEEEMAAGFANDDAFEFLEFFNRGASTIDLIGIRFDDGIDFYLEESYLLEPGAAAVIVSDLAAFRARYGDAVAVIGVYTGLLRNSGDTLSLVDATGEPIAAFAYDDDAPWATEADGGGHSLVLVNPADGSDPADPESWAVSANPGGSPGSAGGTDPTGLTYAQWASEVFSPDQTGMAKKEDDPDEDGYVNLVEFALFGDPLKPDRLSPAIVSSQAWTTIDGVFTRRKEVSGTTITAETSVDLETWATLEPVAAQVQSAGSDSETVTWTFQRDLAGRHFRLRIE